MPVLFVPGLYYRNPFFGKVEIGLALEVCRGPQYTICPETGKIFIIRMTWKEIH